MKTHLKVVWTSLTALAALAMLNLAAAQDFGALKGTSSRTGKNTNPATGGPGQANLRWFTPNLNDGPQGRSIVRDLLSPSAITRLGPWRIPLPNEEANFTYYPADTGNTPENDASGYTDMQTLLAGGTYPAAYEFAATVPSAPGSDPTIKQNAGDTSSIVSWRVEPANAGERLARNYALYVWLPVGATLDINAGTRYYPQRYYVYEILYGNGRRWVDVVDTYQAGSGWIRLGGGGKPTNMMFDYDGATPITIRLHNTVPRDAIGNLSDIPYSSVVYADAVRAVPDVGTYQASPITAALDPANIASPIRTVAALNERSVGVREGTTSIVEKGRVTSYAFDTGQRVWSFSPAEESELAVEQDNTSTGVAAGLPWTVSTVATGFRGINYHTAPIDASDPTDPPAVVYTPTLEDGSYEVYAWLPGSNNGVLFGRAVKYELQEGNTVTTVEVDQDAARGWVRLGTRRFSHDGTNARLRVRVTNGSSNAADGGRFAYADTIRFVGAVNLAINSTPIQVKARVNYPGVGLAERPVTIVAAENGRIYCLDGAGNGDGTTNIIWTYPSTPDPNGSDPNNVVGEDNNIAEMPIGFGLTSGLVERIGGEDFLFIASKNGRIYCIEMAGRGDGDLATRKPGTTRRAWSYPDDYPSTVRTSNLGEFTGSLAYAVTADGPTIFAPTTQGRLYALNATSIGGKKVALRWAFPAVNQPTLGSIEMTPAIEFGKVFFGTTVKSGDDRGRFYALDMDNGNVVWQFNGTTTWGNGTFTNADDFIAGPATASSALLGGGYPNMVFVANENRWITGLNADTGAELWTTDELGVGVLGNLTYTPMSVKNNAGAYSNANVIMVPTADGRLAGLFADPGMTNRYGTRRCYQKTAAGDSFIGSISVGRGWMTAGDTAGNLFSFNNGSGVITPGEEPIVEDEVENSTVGDIFRQTTIKFVSRDMYQRLRQPVGSTSLPTYKEVKDLPETLKPGNAYEWGETMYIVVYRFPFYRNPDTNPAPIVNYAFSVEGAAIRSISIESRKFKAGPGQDQVTDELSGQTFDMDGYTVLAFTLQSGANNALPPGNGLVQVSINTSSLNGRPQNIVPLPQNSRREFKIANPISLVMKYINGTPDLSRSIAYTTDANTPEALANGSPDIPGTAKNESLLGTSVGQLSHGRGGGVMIGVVDRSLLTLIRGPGRGLDNVRATRSDLQWQGGLGSVLKPIPNALFPGFEDYPVNFPNDSLDYPNIRREGIRVTKDPNGSSENPLFANQGAISLNAPTNVDENAPLTRVLQDTPFGLTIDIPTFQPPNLGTILDSGGGTLDGGYVAGMEFYVDTNGDTRRTRNGAQREAFRSYFLGTSVMVDERLEITTPNVNLGSLAGGSGYTPDSPLNGGLFSPFSGPYAQMFQPFTLRNPGNVNLLNLRLAKGTDTGGAVQPWEIYAPANHERAWLDGRLHLHSDIDKQFNFTSQVILQKPRVEDRLPTEFSVNPRRRDNPNLGVLSSLYDPSRPELERPARVTVSIPIGFPTGEYAQTLHVIEDNNDNESLRVDSLNRGLESYSDPSFILNFRVRETRLTNDYTSRTAPMVDDPVALGTGGNFQHQNSQPAIARNLNGSMLIAFSSDRNAFGAAQPATTQVDNATRIYLVGLRGTTPGGGLGPSPLNDLNAWTPDAANRWFDQITGPYPTNPVDTLFDSKNGETVAAATVKFHSPAFPALGYTNPFNNSTNPSLYMAFVGQCQKQTQVGRIDDARIFIAQVQNGLGNPIGMPNDPGVRKGKPSVVQAGTSATVFYSASGTGSSQIYYSVFDGNAWGPSAKWDLGSGFESATQPSAYGRIYQGAGNNPSQGTPLIEVSFIGKLLGRPHSDVFLGRMIANGNGVPQSTAFFPLRTQEILVAGEAGTYFSRGVAYNGRGILRLEQFLNGTLTDLEVSGTRVVNQNTGIISFDSKTGGQVQINPNIGQVKFTGLPPIKTAQVLLTYQAKFLRINGGGTVAGHSSPSLLFDNRLIGEFSYWARSNNTAIQPSDQVRSSRYILTYGRAASGAGQSARPYMQSLRFAIQLPTAIHTSADGRVTNLQVNGATSFYQVDPASGRLYFTDADEARTVDVTYTGVDEANGQPVPGLSANGVVSLRSERIEAPVPIETAVNEAQLSTILDPFDNLNPNNRRVGLIWMVWTSTRSSGPDIFLQSIAPRFTPIAGSRGN